MNGLKNGEGKMVYPNGDVEQGTFKDGKMLGGKSGHMSFN